MKQSLRALFVVTIGLALAACGGGGGGNTGPAVASSPAGATDVLATAKATGSASLMTSAVQSAGLAPMMQGAQRLTFLTPDDASMGTCGNDLDELRKPENALEFEEFIKAHVIDGTLSSADLESAGAPAPSGAPSTAPAPMVKNVLGEPLEVEFEGGALSVNGAEPERLDLHASNGFVHLFKGPLFRRNVNSLVTCLPETSTLEAALRAANLDATLVGKGPFTLFAPTNEAFTALLQELNITADALLANKPLLTQVLTYHVLATRLLSRQVIDGATPTTVEGESVLLNATGQGRNRAITITDARGRTAHVVRANLQARNGVVHLIDRVILPTDQDIVSVATANPNFSILVEALQAAGLVTTLQGQGPYTVLAPTNDAFAALLGELGTTKDALFANKPLLTNVLTYHVLSGRTLANDITDALPSATVQGQPIVFHRSGNALSVLDTSGRTSNIVVTNVQANNGVVHAIDKVLLPTAKNLVQVAQANPNFSILVEAVVAANLTDTLAGAGPLTVFAPTNDAFGKLLAELHLTKDALLADKATLTKVLTYHVVAGQVLSNAIPFGKPIATVQGETITIDRSLKITDQSNRLSTIVAADVGATNGVIHVIDTVLLPK